MASDWAVVAGTAVGATSGLITLWVNRRAATRDRTADREWAVWQLNVDQRRLLYGDLLRLARELEERLTALWLSFTMGIDDERETAEKRTRAGASADAYDEVVAATEVAAMDGRVVELATDLLVNARAAILDSVPLVASAEMRADDAREMQAHLSRIREERRYLRDACRLDVGLENSGFEPMSPP